MIKLYRGDCLEVMPILPDKSIDMILCDLPYGTTQCKWDIIIPFEKLWSEYKRLIKANGAIVLFGSEPFSSVMRMSNLKMYKYDWYWIKEKGKGQLNVKRQPLKSVETISVFNTKNYNPQFSIGKPYLRRDGNKSNLNKGIYGNMANNTTTENSGERYPKTDLYYTSVQRTIHSNQKPVELLEYLIKTYTLKGETVLDNTMGSGSTGVACVNTSRNFIGIEKDCPKDKDKHFRTAIRRITEAGGRGTEVYE